MITVDPEPDPIFEPFVLPSLGHVLEVGVHLGVTPLGQNRFRVEEPVWMSEVQYGDIIEAERREDGKYHWTKTVEEADVVSFTVMTVRTEDLEREEIQALHDEIIDCGGQWEMPADGTIYVELPAEEGPAEEWESRYNDVLTELREQEQS